MSVYHRVDDIFQLPGPKFIRLAERLPNYEGSVRATMRRLSEEVEAAPAPAAVITPESAASLPTLPGMPPLFEFNAA